MSSILLERSAHRIDCIYIVRIVSSCFLNSLAGCQASCTMHQCRSTKLIPLPPNAANMRESYAKPIPSNTQQKLHPLINKKTHRHHRHNLNIPNRQSHPKPPKPMLLIYPPRRLRDSEPMPIAYCSTDLHAPSDYFEGICGGLGNETCGSAGEEFGPGF